MVTKLPFSEETVGGINLPSTVTLTEKEAIMRKVKLIVHETYQGKRKIEDVFVAVFLSNTYDDLQQMTREIITELGATTGKHLSFIMTHSDNIIII